MSELKELEKWLAKIEEIAVRLGLSFYPQEFYLISKQKMIEAMAYHGGYPMYSHWSFGKGLKIGRILYEKNYYFLPYEIVINTNPCRAFLLESNPLFYNILVAAHVFGHNDFFKNNRLFAETKPETILSELEKYRRRIESFIDDEKIGTEKIEKVIDASHAMMFLSTGENFYDFMIENCGRLEQWEKEILEAVKIVNNHLRPQLRTKIINEGWATYWHDRIIEELKPELEFNDYFAMRMAHLRVIRMPQNPEIINPYRVGYFLWKKIEKEFGREKMFEIRKESGDFEFLLTYFNNKGDFIYENFIKAMAEILAEELKNMPPGERKALLAVLPFSIDSNGKLLLNEEIKQHLVDELRKKILAARGENVLPKFEISVEKWANEDRLYLKHVFDDRPLDIGESLEVLKMIQPLWGESAVLETTIEEKDALYTHKKTIKFICREGRIIAPKVSKK